MKQKTYTIYRKCGWCGKNMGTKKTKIKPNPVLGNVTHGMCKKCFIKMHGQKAWGERIGG